MGFGEGFLKGFTRTTIPLMQLQLAKQRHEAQQANERERIKIQQDLLKGKAAEFKLRQEEAKQRLLAIHQRQQGRREAGSALALLGESNEQRGFALDPQSQGELQGIVTRQQAAEGQFPLLEKIHQRKQDRQRRQELAQSLDTLLDDLPQGQAVFGRAVLKTFTSGGIDDAKLFRIFDNFAGNRGPTSMLSLAFLAAGQGPRAKQAQRALQLLPDQQRTITASALAFMAQQPGEVGKQAQAALDALMKLRQTGVRSRKRKQPAASGFQLTPQGDVPEPQLTPTPGGGVQGKGTGNRPRVKSFRRVQ